VLNHQPFAGRLTDAADLAQTKFVSNFRKLGYALSLKTFQILILSAKGNETFKALSITETFLIK